MFKTNKIIFFIEKNPTQTFQIEQALFKLNSSYLDPFNIEFRPIRSYSILLNCYFRCSKF